MSFRYFGLVCVLALLPGLSASQDKPPKLPPKVDLQPEFTKFRSVPRVQGKRDTCSLFAITAVAEYEYNRSNRKAPKLLSEEFLVWAANESTGLTGDQAMFYEAAHGLNALGICRADLAPYQQQSAVPPSKQAIADARELSNRWRINWIKRWDIKRTLSDEELNAIKATLANGHPVAVGLRWPKKLQGSALLDVPVTEDVFDGHSIVFAGYVEDPKKKGGDGFLFRNSSGLGWGQNGYGFMSYAYARAYVNDAVWLECGAPGSETPAERFETETLTVLSQEKCPAETQSTESWGGLMWSGGKHLFCKAAEGGSIELEFNVSRPGRYRVRLLATAAPDFGSIRVAIDGKKSGTEFDLYAGRVCPAGSLELGEHQLTADKHVLRVDVAGKNKTSMNCYFGLDTLDLISLK